jgi:hypothetical protein
MSLTDAGKRLSPLDANWQVEVLSDSVSCNVCQRENYMWIGVVQGRSTTDYIVCFPGMHRKGFQLPQETCSNGRKGCHVCKRDQPLSLSGGELQVMVRCRQVWISTSTCSAIQSQWGPGFLTSRVFRASAGLGGLGLLVGGGAWALRRCGRPSHIGGNTVVAIIGFGEKPFLLLLHWPACILFHLFLARHELRPLTASISLFPSCFSSNARLSFASSPPQEGLGPRQIFSHPFSLHPTSSANASALRSADYVPAAAGLQKHSRPCRGTPSKPIPGRHGCASLLLSTR